MGAHTARAIERERERDRERERERKRARARAFTSLLRHDAVKMARAMTTRLLFASIAN